MITMNKPKSDIIQLNVMPKKKKKVGLPYPEIDTLVGLDWGYPGTVLNSRWILA